MRTSILSTAGLAIALTGLLSFPAPSQADIVEAGTSANLTVRTRADDRTTRRIQAQPLIGSASQVATPRNAVATPRAADGLPPRDHRSTNTIVRTRPTVEPVVVRPQPTDSDRSEPASPTHARAGDARPGQAADSSSRSRSATSDRQSDHAPAAPGESHIFVTVPVEPAANATPTVQVSTQGQSQDAAGVFNSDDDPGQTISQAALAMFAPQASDPDRYEIDQTQANQLAGGRRYVTVTSQPVFIHTGPTVVHRGPARVRPAGTLYYHPRYGYLYDYRPAYVTTQSGIVTSNAHFVTTRTVAYPPVVFHHRPVVRHRTNYVCRPVHRPVIIRHHHPCGSRVGIRHRSSNFGLSVNLRF